MAHSDLMLAPSSNGRGGSQARWLRPLSAAGLGAVAGALVVAAAGRRKASHTRSPAVMDGTPERRLYSGRDVSQALSVADLRAIAHRRLPRFALEYLEGGADDEATLARNRAALARYYFTHRSFVDVAHRDISTTLFGKKMTMPVAIAPTGLNELFWPHADLRLAEAAGACGIAFAQSTMSNDPMEQVGKVPGLRHWWQLYVFGPQVVQDTLIERARRAGCEALIVTDDAQIFGNRVWSRRNNSGPKDLSWSAKLDAALHPRCWIACSSCTPRISSAGVARTPISHSSRPAPSTTPSAPPTSRTRR